jgi:nitrite reductase/ring-hydroxylating ferredoxin subunit
MHDTELFTPARRRFLEKIFAATVLTVAAPSLVLGRIIPRLRPTSNGFAGRYRIDLTNPTFAKLTTVGGSMKLASIAGLSFRVIVTRTSETTFAAVDATCTHDGCVVNEVRANSGGFLVCPCHSSRFTPEGAVNRGPAASPLRSFATFFDGGNIVEIEIDGIASSPEEIASSTFVGTPFVDRDGSSVTLDVALEATSGLRAAVYSASGELATPVFDGTLAAGEHELRATLDGLAAGAYIFRIESPRGVIARKFVVSR